MTGKINETFLLVHCLDVITDVKFIFFSKLLASTQKIRRTPLRIPVKSWLR